MYTINMWILYISTYIDTCVHIILNYIVKRYILRTKTKNLWWTWGGGMTDSMIVKIVFSLIRRRTYRRERQQQGSFSRYWWTSSSWSWWGLHECLLWGDLLSCSFMFCSIFCMFIILCILKIDAVYFVIFLFFIFFKKQNTLSGYSAFLFPP